MGGQFSDKDPARCPHYAKFMSHLDRVHFDSLYWTLFFLVVMALFTSSWIYQWAMRYRESPTYRVEKFRKKIILSLVITLVIFSFTTVIVVIEVYALLALQFCDGEDLMSLYWATWTMLQLGSEIAILGVSLALWHHLWDIEHPTWALALGTPVLVVAGFGHLLTLVVLQFYHKAKGTNKEEPEREATTGGEGRDMSLRTSIEPFHGGNEKRDQYQDLEPGRVMYFAMDTGDDEKVRGWPCFVRMAGGRAVIRMAVVPEPDSASTRRPDSSTTHVELPSSP